MYQDKTGGGGRAWARATAVVICLLGSLGRSLWRQRGGEGGMDDVCTVPSVVVQVVPCFAGGVWSVVGGGQLGTVPSWRYCSLYIVLRSGH